MVSTRNSKDKFVDGEKVLCYEPDSTKAKVLYDSKVLEVKYLKDKRGRRVVYYLVHFHGWNSSWDRLVSEDYILKDTEKNRNLQRELQLQYKALGAYLFRPESLCDGSNLSEKAYEAGNSCSSQDVASAEDDYLTATDDDKESSAETDDSLEQKVPLHISPNIKLMLEHDSERINGDEKLVKLPASPTIVQILEMYFRHFAKGIVERDGGEECPRSRHNRQTVVPPRPTEKHEELEWVTAQINLVKEVVQGLRICFDFYCESQLLYSVEKSQFYQAVGFKMDLSEDESIRQEERSDRSSNTSTSIVESADVERRRSLRSHKDHTTDNSTPAVNGVNKLTAKNLHAAVGGLTPNYCSARSTSSTSSYCGPSTGNPDHLANNLTPEMGKLLNLCSNWRLVPDSYLMEVPRHPSAIYGAIHLARLFVKLPLILYDANSPETDNQPRHLSDHKMKLLLHHLKLFITFLENNSEWFDEEHYEYKLKIKSAYSMR